jgi:YVTN family beta-propeller protein
METWNNLFEGGSGGASVIPYRPDQSWVTYFTNTDSTKGVILTPTMPYLRPPLSFTEWQTLYDWIAAGAPDKNGNIAFSGNPNRKKFYVSNQGCDLVSVFDADSKICMRCIDPGKDLGPGIALCQIKVSPDKQFWYAVLANATVIQKFNATDDSYVGSVKIGIGNWNTMAITGDGKYAFVVDWNDLGKVAYVDLENLQLIRSYYGFTSPHGSWVNKAGTTVYVTSQSGNYIYEIDVTDPDFPTIEEIVMNAPQSPNNIENTFDPHEVILSPDESKYFVTCQANNSVRVFDASTDTLIKVIPVSESPVDFAISLQRNLLFVTCEQEPCNQSHCKGAVDIIDLNTLEVVKVLQDNMYVPHAIDVMDDEGYAIVASRNTDASGPSPHHVSECSGRNGYIQLIDLNTLEVIPNYRIEVSVDPYSLSVRE